jgi:hypothetical protein
VKENAPAGGHVWFGASREETGDNPGKNVARTGSGQADIAEAAECKILLVLRYERSGPLKSYGGTKRPRCLTSKPFRVGFYLRPIVLKEAGHFSRMGGEDDVLPMRFAHAGVADGL